MSRFSPARLRASFDHWVRFDGLGPRLAALLTVALLPLGIVSLDQTRDLADEAERRAGLTLVALTREAAGPLQQGVQRATGAAEALAQLAGRLDSAPGAACRAALEGFVGPGSPYAHVAVVPAAGGSACAAGEPLPPTLDPARRAARLASGEAPATALVEGDDSVLLVTTPYGEAGRIEGVVAVALRRSAIAPAIAPGPAERPQRVLVVNAEGSVVEDLGVGGPDPGAPLEEMLPPGLDLGRAALGVARVEEQTGADGAERIYTVTPLVAGGLSAIGLWDPDQGQGEVGPLPAAPVLFPLLMWVASLLVAAWAANRLVVRPVAALGEAMRRFGADRSLSDTAVPADTPRELRDIDAAFRDAASAILRDEARMEDAFRERGVLLREIHHRVKNNLQLISSIISMQIRRAPDTRTRMILRRLQDRVLTLAAIYRTLYTSLDMSEASVAPILRAIVEQEVAAQPGRIMLSLDLEDIVLDADKSVPLAFLVAEAVSNATQQAALASGERKVGVSLRRVGAEAVVEVVNVIPANGGADLAKGPGLGAHLIAAFTVQLGGRALSGPRDGLYRLTVTFPLAGHAPDHHPDHEPAGERSGEQRDRLSA